MNKCQMWYPSSVDGIRITSRDGKEMPWDDLRMWLVRDDKVPSIVRPDKTERVTFALPGGCPKLAKGSVVSVYIDGLDFVGDATVLSDLPYDNRGVGRHSVHLEWGVR